MNFFYGKEPRYMMYLSFLYFTNAFFFTGTYIAVGSTIWLAIPIGALLSLPLLYFYSRWFITHKLNIVMRFLAFLIAAYITILCFYGISNFIKLCVMTNTSIYLFPSFLLLFSLWIASKDVHVLQRFSKLMGPIIFAMLILSILSAISKIDPHFSNTLSLYLSEAFYTEGTGSFVTMTAAAFFIFLSGGFLLITLLGIRKKTPDIFKEVSKGLLISAFFSSVAFLATVFVLGAPVFELLTYPIYYPPGLTRTAEYLERTEIILLAVFTISEFVRVSILFLVMKETLLYKLLNPDRQVEKSSDCHSQNLYTQHTP